MEYYHYFVSCSFSNGHMGMIDYAISKEISSFDDILEMCDFIAKESNRNPRDVSIINYQLIRDEPY